MATASTSSLQHVLDILDGVRSQGDGFIARCPVHDDRHQSLSITEKDGKVLVKCHAGCGQGAVIEALRQLGAWPLPRQGTRRAARHDLGLALHVETATALLNSINLIAAQVHLLQERISMIEFRQEREVVAWRDLWKRYAQAESWEPPEPGSVMPVQPSRAVTDPFVPEASTR